MSPSPPRAHTLHVDGKYIKDSNGNVVYLRGCGIWAYDNDPCGVWDGHWGVWNENYVRNNMAAMKSWGQNCVRFHTVADWWIQDYNSYRNHLQRAIQIAQEYGLYVIFDLFSAVNGVWLYKQGVGPSAIPYPPYNSYPDVEVFKSKQDFVNYWANVANLLKNEPNVIFELYNEPNANWAAKNGFPWREWRASWWDAMQQAITAIRNTGSTNLILCEWGGATGPGSTWDSPYSVSMDWIEHANLQGSNIFYAGHIYRGTYNPNWSSSYSTIYTQMQSCKFDYVLNTLNKPVIIGEMGVDLNVSGDTQWGSNVLNICNQWGMGYSAWCWNTGDMHKLITTYSPSYTPSAWGQALINAIANGGTQA